MRNRAIPVRMIDKLRKMISTEAGNPSINRPLKIVNDKDTKIPNSSTIGDKFTKNSATLNGIEKPLDQYVRVIQDLNSLQSNSQTLALSKYRRPEEILPLFAKQLQVAGIDIEDLNRLNIVHVSGTKGKGSTCAFAESILRAAGLKTGFYNSPHLIKVTERIRLNGIPIEEDAFSSYFRKVYDALREGAERKIVSMPSYFSFLTILAFRIFLEEKVDCAVIEVGIGGEYDPTNIIQKPVVCGISTLDYDHTSILGNTIESIAWAKAGIAKKGVPLFMAEQDKDPVLEVVKLRTLEKNSPLYICKPLKVDPGLQLGIHSPVQYNNASLACQLARCVLERVYGQKFEGTSRLKGDAVVETDLTKLPMYFKDALALCFWPGRCQVVKYPRITFFLDGAHTKKSMKNCLNWFLSLSLEEDEKVCRILMINIIGDRNKMEVLRPLTTYEGFESVIFSTNRINSSPYDLNSPAFAMNDKGMDNVQTNAKIWTSLQETTSKSPDIVIKPNTFESIAHVDKMSRICDNRKCHVLVTGSLHFVGAILETLPHVDSMLNRSYLGKDK